MAALRLFESRKIRSTWMEEEGQWYFAIADIVEILADTNDPKDYIKKIKLRDKELSEAWDDIVMAVPMDGLDGRKRKVNAANLQGIFRIIQSVTSPKAEPFKRWLAQVGAERIQEIEDPEKAQVRIRETYQAKGYPQAWIDKRMRGIAVRDTLTAEWSKRGVKEGKDFSILTAEIAKATFGLKPSDHKQHKGLTKPSENLRDHMTDLELIFTMLGEASTTEIAQQTDAQGLQQNKRAAKAGGEIAGRARRELEQKSGKKVVSASNARDITSGLGDEPMSLIS